MQWLIANFNTISGFASIIGSLLGLPALLIALIQISKAETAAKNALQRISSVVSVAAIEQLCSRSRDLVHLMRARNLVGSATAAFELREALSKFSKLKAGKQIQNETGQIDILDTVIYIHDALENAAAIKKIDADLREELLQGITRVHSQLSMLAAVSGEKAGGIYDYSE
jgi:hypothetical protein